MDMDKVPHYTEGVDPGFREHLAADFAEPIPESQEQMLLRSKLKILMLAELVG
jgi:hypothetical protein